MVYKGFGVYNGAGVHNGAGVYHGAGVYKPNKYNIPYYSQFKNFDFLNLKDNPIIGYIEFIRNHQGLIYSNENITYNGETFNALKVTQPGGNIAAPDEIFNFGGKDYEIEFIQKIEKNNNNQNFSIWVNFGNNWFGLALNNNSNNLMLLFDVSNYSLYNGSSFFISSGGYNWIDTNSIGLDPNKIKIKSIANKIEFYVDDILKASVIYNDVFVNCFNFSPRFNKPIWITDLKINWS